MESAYLPVANASFIEEDILAWRPMKALDFLLFVDLSIFLRFFLLSHSNIRLINKAYNAF